MKIIKKSLLVAAGLLAGNILMAQDLKPEMAKPIAPLKASPAQDNTPDPKLMVNGAPAENKNEKQNPGTGSSVTDTKTAAPTDENGVESKPMPVPQTKPLTQETSTINEEKRANTGHPPRTLPDPNTDMPVAPPAKTDMKKPGAVQQKPGQH